MYYIKHNIFKIGDQAKKKILKKTNTVKKNTVKEKKLVNFILLLNTTETKLKQTNINK